MVKEHTLIKAGFLLCYLLIAACEDGENGGGSTRQTLSQTLNFTHAGPLALVVGASVSNPAIGMGTGDVSYRSSDDTLAMVDTDGTITALAAGRATITAVIAADSQYSAAYASYDNQIVVDKFTVTMWVGTNDTEVDFSPGTAGIKFRHSCNSAKYSDCADGQLDILADQTVLDTAHRLDRTANYSFQHSSTKNSPVKNGVSSLKVMASHQKVPQRLNHQVTEFDGKLWLIGGTEDSVKKNDVWSSANGINWTEETPSTGFSPRHFHGVAAFAGRLWVIGGAEDQSTKNDVWSSSDGINWTEETASAAFYNRWLHQVTVFDGKLWVIGGMLISGEANDVWSSTDGIRWTEETPNAEFSARQHHQVTVFDERLWVIGGYEGDYSNRKNDVWSSRDGITWTEETASAGFSVRSSHQVTAFDGKLWVIGGFDFRSKNDVWSSHDGINWIEDTNSAAFSARSSHQVVAFAGKLWVIGGVDVNGIKHDAWSSTDGIEWRRGYRHDISFSRTNR